MGSGLIFAGLGKGIADAGATYGNMMYKAAEAEEADRRALQRADALEKLKEEREDAKLKRDADIYSQAQARAQEIGAERQSKSFDKLAESSALAGEQGDMALSKEQLQDLVASNPELRKQYQDMGLISKSMSGTRQEMQGYDDVVSEARKLGASSTLVKSLQDAKKTRLEEIKAEFTEKREDNRYELEQKREERRDREFKALLPIKQQTADASTTRAEKTGSGSGGSGGGAPTVRSTYVDPQGNKVAVMSDSSTKVLGPAGDFDKSVSRVINEMSNFNNPGSREFNKLSESEKRARAIERLTGSAPAARRDNSGAAPANRPPLSSFAR